MSDNTILILAVLILGALLCLICGCSFKSPVPAGLPESEMDDYAEGLRDGERDAHGNEEWMIWGCLLCPFGPAISWSVSVYQKPPVYGFLGKSQDYVKGYTEAYQQKSAVKNTNYAWKGCAIGGGMWLVAYMLLLSFSNLFI